MVHSTGKSGVHCDLTVAVHEFNDNGGEHEGDGHAEQAGERRRNYGILIHRDRLYKGTKNSEQQVRFPGELTEWNGEHRQRIHTP